MSQPIKASWQLIQDALKLQDNETLDTIKRETQKNYYRLCELTDWQGLRQVKEITFTGNETDGVYLPSDLIGIMSVVCETSGSRKVYHPTTEQRRYFDREKYRWYYPDVKVSELDTLTSGININHESLAFTGTLGGDRTGEYIRFDTEPGLYLVAALKTFTPR